mmetsp:Transcript_23300/g.69783  ORF Transcript_23300/g.69783 Transcript_23300/m.69783 type:complete len:108 (-) Transcript_23300:28-351(-)
MPRIALALLTLIAAPSAAFLRPTPPHAAVARPPLRAESETEEILEIFEDAAAAPAAAGAAADDEEDDDPGQQTRVLAYMGLSLLPILGLIPFFSGRDFVPADPSLYT